MDRRPRRRSIRDPQPDLRWESARAPGQRHATLADFVLHAYVARFGARAPAIMPELCALLDTGGHPVAVAGFRNAARDSLFLEQYLDMPIEAAITAATGGSALREEIWEVGNLATHCPGAARYFVSAAADKLVLRGATWAVFTGTRRVVAVFRRLGIPLLTLAEASPDRIVDGGRGWGDYYSHAPRVVLGQVRRVPANADDGVAP